jgi:hypothetical protein
MAVLSQNLILRSVICPPQPSRNPDNHTSSVYGTMYPQGNTRVVVHRDNRTADDRHRSMIGLDRPHRCIREQSREQQQAGVAIGFEDPQT